jgi:hypothetical protein
MRGWGLREYFWAAVAIGVIGYVWSDPHGAADTVHAAMDLCKQGIQAVITFVKELTA